MIRLPKWLYSMLGVLFIIAPGCLAQSVPGLQKLTSTGGTVTITSPNGPVVNVESTGGVALQFATNNLPGVTNNNAGKVTLKGGLQLNQTAGNTLTVTGGITSLDGGGVITDGGGDLTANNFFANNEIIGIVPVSDLNSGTGATSSTFWRGDGTWGTPPGASFSGDASQFSSTSPTKTITGARQTNGEFLTPFNSNTSTNNSAMVVSATDASGWLETGVTPTGSLAFQIDALGDFTSFRNITADVSLIGNVPVSDLNAGSGANNTTFWRGDGTWATPPGSGGSFSGNAAQFSTAAGTTYINVGATVSNIQSHTPLLNNYTTNNAAFVASVSDDSGYGYLENGDDGSFRAGIDNHGNASFVGTVTSTGEGFIGVGSALSALNAGALVGPLLVPTDVLASGTPSGDTVLLGNQTWGPVSTVALGSGTASSATFLRGDKTWVSVPGGGDTNILDPVQNFGADPSDTVDSYLAFSNCFYLAMKQRATVIIPPGIYSNSSYFNITNPITIFGGGMTGIDGVNGGNAALTGMQNQTGSLMVWSNTTTVPCMNFIACKSASIMNVGFQNNATNTSQNYIVYCTNSDCGQEVDFDHVSFQGSQYQVGQFAGGGWNFHKCNFLYSTGSSAHALFIANYINSDCGDHAISDCNFLTETYLVSSFYNAIYCQSSGGVKMSNVKINNYPDGIVMIPTGGNTSDFQLSNVSIENCNYGIIAQPGDGSVWDNWTLSGIQLLMNASGSSSGITMTGGIGNHSTILGVVARGVTTGNYAIYLNGMTSVHANGIIVTGNGSAFSAVSSSDCPTPTF